VANKSLYTLIFMHSSYASYSLDWKWIFGIMLQTNSNQWLINLWHNFLERCSVHY